MIVRGIASKQNRDLQNTVIVADAFDEAIARRGAAGIALLLCHDAKRPAGRILSLQTIDKALHITARLDAAGINAHRDMTKDGATLGFSIAARDVTGMQVGDLTFVTKADLYEVSLTPHPVNPECLLTFADRNAHLWPEDWREMFAEQDAAIAAAPRRIVIPTIRYEEVP